MAEVQASNNSKDIDFDRHKFTFDWATKTIIRLQNLTNALESSQNSESLPWHLHGSISDVLDSFFILDEQKDCFDFDCFKHPNKEFVTVFGRPYESYHAAVREIVDAVVHAIWFPAFFVYDGTTIARQNANVARIVVEDIPDITAAFYNATSVEQKDIKPLLLKLGAGLCTEYPVLNVKVPSETSDTEEESPLTLPAATANDVPDDATWSFSPGAAKYKTTEIAVNGIRWKLLKALVESETALTVDNLMAAGWEHDNSPDEKTVRTHLSELRKLLRRKLNLSKDFDPIPNCDRGALSAWKLDSRLR